MKQVAWIVLCIIVIGIGFLLMELIFNPPKGNDGSTSKYQEELKQGDEVTVNGPILQIDTAQAAAGGPVQITMRDQNRKREFVILYDGTAASCGFKSDSTPFAELELNDPIEVFGVVLGENKISFCGNNYYLYEIAQGP